MKYGGEGCLLGSVNHKTLIAFDLILSDINTGKKKRTNKKWGGSKNKVQDAGRLVCEFHQEDPGLDSFVDLMPVQFILDDLKRSGSQSLVRKEHFLSPAEQTPTFYVDRSKDASMFLLRKLR